MRSPAGLLVACAATATFGQPSPASQQLFLQGFAAYQGGNFEVARDGFEGCLKLEPDRTDCMTNYASVLIDIGGEGSDTIAEELYRRVLTLEPAHSDAAFNLAMLLQDRRTEEAMREAATLYLEVTAVDPKRWDAWSNLAAALSELPNSFLGAGRAYQRAIVELERSHEETSTAMEPSEEELGYLAQLYFGLGALLAGLSPKQCAAFAAQADQLLVGVEPGGHVADAADEAWAASVCLENAQNALRNALAIEPEHAQAEHMLASITPSNEGGGVSKASAAFVTALFDDFSDTFDQKLASLQYAVPALLGKATAAFVRQFRGGAPFASALDAGCGTGLAGPYLRPLVTGPLTGVDLSQKMLDRAAKLVDDTTGAPTYDQLLARDLVTLPIEEAAPRQLVAGAGGVELITAADVLVYFGELRELFENFAHISSASSALIFSCERVTPADAPSGWRLNTSGRFAHTKEYVVNAARAAGGFELVSYEEITPRLEGGKAVQGHLFVFMR